MATCPHCKREFKGDRINSRHMAKCWPNWKPEPITPCICGHESTSNSQMKRHKSGCEVWQGRDKKAIANARRKNTYLKRYGVENPAHSKESVEKRKQTNLNLYGAENPFSKESSVFKKVQDALEGKRPVLKGKDNPFAWESVQDKIKQTNLEKYGVVNPQQNDEVKAKTEATNLERYGGTLFGSAELRAKIEATNIERYGVPIPSMSEEVMEKVVATNMERYGVPYTGAVEEFRQKQLKTMIENYGSHYFASEQGKGEIRATMMDRYGVEFPGAIEGHWDKVKETNLKRYGVEHPLQLQEFREKQYATNMERYGTPFLGLVANDMNGFESRVASYSDNLTFTGNGAYWRFLPSKKNFDGSIGGYKNPDFVVCVSDDPEHPYRGATKVVECFGDYWHGESKTGMSKEEHERNTIEAYAEVGLDCLVIWEGDIRSDEESVIDSVQSFLTS